MAGIKIKVVEFDLTTGAVSSTQNITSTGFGTVKAARFIVSGATANDTITAGDLLCFGFTDGTNHAAWGARNEDGVTNTNNYRCHSDAHCIAIPNLADSSFVGQFTASFITDGVQLTVADPAVSSWKCICILYGGDDLLNATVGSYDDLGTGTAAIDINTLTFEPTVVHMGGTSATTAPSTDVHLISCYGIGLNDGVDTQRVISWGTLDNQSSSPNTGYVGNDSIVAQSWAGALQRDSIIETYDATGFSINPNASMGNMVIHYLAMEFASGVGVDLFDMEWSTTGDYAETNPATFTPGYGEICSLAGPTARNTADGTASHAVGITAFDDTTLLSISGTSEDGASPTQTTSYENTALKLIAEDGITTAVEGTFDGFDSVGWDFSLTTNPVTNPILGFGLAIEGEGAAAIEITNVTYLPPTGFDYVAFSGGAIPSDSIYYINDGTATGGTTTTATTTLNLTLNEYAGLVWNNTTKAETSVIASNTAGPNSTITFVDTLTATTNGDAFQIEIDIDTNDQTQYETAATVSSEQYDFDYAIVDLTDDSHSATETITVTATGAEDGVGTVSLSVLGVPTFTYAASSTVGSGGLEADEIIRKKKPKDIDNQMFNTTGNYDLDNISSDGGFGIDEA